MDNVQAPSDNDNVSDNRSDKGSAPPIQPGQCGGQNVQKNEEHDKDKKSDVDAVPWIITVIGSLTLAGIGMLGALTALFVGRSSHGQAVGRLSIRPTRIDATGRRILFRVRNTGVSPLFSVRIEGACRAHTGPMDFSPFLIEELSAGQDMLCARPFTTVRAFTGLLVDGPEGKTDVVFRVRYSDHADRSRFEKRNYRYVAGAGYHLIVSKTRMRWYSIG
ncbi:hypothetical protein E5673_14795 [Sphingomonas sp. PAMC26645]|nr:hypothetical protein E5673_14795 [Sphingomonas sp. PAMC26645]